jgi:hypothetical protein
LSIPHLYFALLGFLSDLSWSHCMFMSPVEKIMSFCYIRIMYFCSVKGSVANLCKFKAKLFHAAFILFFRCGIFYPFTS